MKRWVAVAVAGFLTGTGLRALGVPIPEPVLWGLLVAGTALWIWATWRERHPRRLR